MQKTTISQGLKPGKETGKIANAASGASSFTVFSNQKIPHGRRYGL
ncbi:MAG: hypothetical protein ABSG16_00840 [Candidatus Acidiferrum sp.]|jgi:hypothetical protein